MKRTILTSAIILGLSMTTFADSGGVFQRGAGRIEPTGGLYNRETGVSLPIIPGHGYEDNLDAPLSGGIAVLTVFGAAYLVGKKRKENSEKQEGSPRRSPLYSNDPRRISGILFPFRGDCHFSRPAVAHRLKRPTLRRRTSSPFAPEGALPLYLDLQPIRFTSAECRHPSRELLPHVFTLTPRQARGGIFFCGTFCYPFGHLPVKKYGALCCPDFPRAGFPDPRQSA